MCLLVMVSANPGRSCNHGDDGDDDTEDTPCEDGGWGVLDMAMLEGAYDSVNEPGDTRSSAA